MSKKLYPTGWCPRFLKFLSPVFFSEKNSLQKYKNKVSTKFKKYIYCIIFKIDMKFALNTLKASLLKIVRKLTLNDKFYSVNY